MDATTRTQAVHILRWLGVLPAALAAAWLGWILVNVLGRFSLAYAGVEAESFLGKFYFNSAGHLVLGMAFVYAGAKMAPLHRKLVAYVFAALGLVGIGFMLFPSVAVGNGWAIWGSICAAIGVGAVVYAVHQGETDLL
jgi:hypothetical protein